MKSTESKNKKRIEEPVRRPKNHTGKQTGKKRRKRRVSAGERILNLLLLLVTLAVLASVGLIAFSAYRAERTLDLSIPYSEADESPGFSSPLDLSRVRRASSFAENLCVTENSQPLEGVEIGEREKAGLFDLDDGKTLFAQNVHDRVYPASITKIMTAMLVLEYGHMEETVTMQPEDLDLEEGSQMSRMQARDTVTVDQLFHTLMIYSANDAAMALARHIGGTVEGFVEMMNTKAAALGMTNTHFVNPHGLHDDNHYTSAYDVYLMLNAAFSYPKFAETMRMDSYTLQVTHADGSVSPLYFLSTDQYLTGEATAPDQVTVLGGKTGTTSLAGSCLALVSQNAYGKPFISVIMNAQNKSALYEHMNTLLTQINSENAQNP